MDIDWFSPTYIGIDQGAMLIMIENYRSGLVHSLFMQDEYAKKAMQNAGFTDVDTTLPAIIQVKKKNNTITAIVTDNTDVSSVVLHCNAEIEMIEEGKVYSAEVPDNLTEYYIEAKDTSGNTATSRIFNETPNLLLPAPKSGLPSSSSLVVDTFDECVSKNGAGAWHGGSSTTEDCLIMFDSSVNRGATGCSMKIRYNVEKKGSYNGAWIKLGNLDLSNYKELVFWVKGDKKEGYTTTFKIELKNPNGKGEYVVKGVTDSWREIKVPLNNFKIPAGDWSSMTEFTIVFEDWRATDKKGVIYIDNIYFIHNQVSFVDQLDGRVS